jgi:hypothetical protein
MPQPNKPNVMLPLKAIGIVVVVWYTMAFTAYLLRGKNEPIPIRSQIATAKPNIDPRLALGSDSGRSSNPASTATSQPNIPISDLTWEELDRIYDVESGYTDLQKKEAWKLYKGRKVR